MLTSWRHLRMRFRMWSVQIRQRCKSRSQSHRSLLWWSRRWQHRTRYQGTTWRRRWHERYPEWHRQRRCTCFRQRWTKLCSCTSSISLQRTQSLGSWLPQAHRRRGREYFLSSILKDILYWCSSKRPSNRYPSANSMSKRRGSLHSDPSYGSRGKRLSQRRQQ